MSRRRHLLAFAGAALLFAGAANAQDPLDRFAGRPVTQIRIFVEETPVSSPALLALIDAREGQPLVLDQVRETERRLERLPQYEDVLVLGEEAPGGVVLTFRLEPRHPVDRLEFAGELTGLPRDELDRRVKEQFGGLPTGDRWTDVEPALRRILEEEGYRSPTITLERVLTHEPDRATLRFTIDAGPRTLIDSVQVNGESPLTVQDILDRTQTTVGSPYRERELAQRLTALRDELSARGFYGAIARHLVTDVGPARVALTLVVNAGPVVELRVEPPAALPGDVETFIPIKREGSVDDDLLDDARNRIRNALQRQGYARAEVSYSRNTETANLEIVTFTIARGKLYRVARVEPPTGLRIPPATIFKLLGIEPRDVWDPQALATGVGRIAGEYHRLGFFKAKVAALPPDEVPERGTDTEAWVVIRLEIEEGPQATVGDVVFDLGASPNVSPITLREVMQSQPGDPYIEAIVAADRRALFEEYGRRGFSSATVQIERRFSADERTVTLGVIAREGPQMTVSEIIVVGNERIDTAEVLREMTLQVGLPYSDEARFESRRRLLTTTSYRNVTITPEPGVVSETGVRVIVAVEEAPATAMGFGGGIEIGSRPRNVAGGGVEDQIELSPRAFFEIGRRNLGGRNRSINLFSRLSLKPASSPDPERDGRGFGFAEYRVTATLREQNAFRTESDLLFGLTSEQAVRTSFNFIRRSANAEFLHRLTPAINFSGRYALEFNQLFDERLDEEEQLLIDRIFPEVRLSFFSGGFLWDRRDSPLAPTRGTQIIADTEIALRQIGSEVGFVKSFYQASFFHPIGANRRTVLATRAQFGVARGFERLVAALDENGAPVFDPGGAPVFETIADLPASHRFFAGGSTTVRGFQLDRLGDPRLLNPDGSSNGGVLNENGLSNGGNALIVLNAELRTVVGRLFGRNLAVAGFLDGGNVFDRVAALDLDRLRRAAGFGLRYDSPLGPIRFDVGFKMNRFVFNGRRERAWEYHLSIGEAF